MKKYERLNTQKFIEKAKLIHKDKYDYSHVDFKNSTIKIILICNTCKNKWESIPSNHLQGRGCKKCADNKSKKEQRNSNETFLKKAKIIHGDNYTYLSEYINFKSNIKIKCNNCFNEFLQRAGSHLSGSGCRKCQYKKLPQNQARKVEDFEKLCIEKHNNKYSYSGDYTNGKNKIKIFCKIHEEYFLQNADAHLLKKQGCPKCNYSHGEAKIDKYLKGKNIKFEVQKQFKKCKYKQNLKFDFYIPKYHLCIEYDGIYHYSPVSYFGGETRFEETKIKDEIKTNFCLNNNIRLLRISYLNYNDIESILENLFEELKNA